MYIYILCIYTFYTQQPIDAQNQLADMNLKPGMFHYMKGLRGNLIGHLQAPQDVQIHLAKASESCQMNERVELGRKGKRTSLYSS